MELDISQIQSVIPHRYPFLLVDKIVDFIEGEKAIGIKNVSINEPFFTGHFPEYPVMPGVLLVEALAQVGAVIALSMDEYKGKIAFFAGIEKFRFRAQVKPGDTVYLTVEMKQLKRGIGKAVAKASVNDKIVAEGELMFAIKHD